MALARTGNVDANELYSFFTNDTIATNNIISIGGQVVALSLGLGAASVIYAAIRGGANPNVTDFRVDSIINDLLRDQTAAENIISTLGYASIISLNYYIFAQFGEPANRRNFLKFADLITKRQGGFNPFEFIFGFLDGVLSYSVVLRTIVFYAIGASGIVIFWTIMSFLPNTPPGKRKRKKRSLNKTDNEDTHLKILQNIHDNQWATTGQHDD